MSIALGLAVLAILICLVVWIVGTTVSWMFSSVLHLLKFMLIPLIAGAACACFNISFWIGFVPLALIAICFAIKEKMANALPSQDEVNDPEEYEEEEYEDEEDYVEEEENYEEEEYDDEEELVNPPINSISPINPVAPVVPISPIKATPAPAAEAQARQQYSRYLLAMEHAQAEEKQQHQEMLNAEQYRVAAQQTGNRAYLRLAQECYNNADACRRNALQYRAEADIHYNRYIQMRNFS